MEIERDYAHVNGTRLYYEVAGSGPPLVLIHGYTLDTRMWDDQFQPFARHYRVLRYDARGFGRSAPPDRKSYTHRDDLMALINHLGMKRPHLCGLSMGAGIAIDFALAFPALTGSVVCAEWHWPNDDPRQARDRPLIQEIARLRVPALFIVGEHDMRAVHDAAETFEREAPKARRVVLPDAGHMTNMEAPGAFNEAVLSFLSEPRAS